MASSDSAVVPCCGDQAFVSCITSLYPDLARLGSDPDGVRGHHGGIGEKKQAMMLIGMSSSVLKNMSSVHSTSFEPSFTVYCLEMALRPSLTACRLCFCLVSTEDCESRAFESGMLAFEP